MSSLTNKSNHHETDCLNLNSTVSIIIIIIIIIITKRNPIFNSLSISI